MTRPRHWPSSNGASSLPSSPTSIGLRSPPAARSSGVEFDLVVTAEDVGFSKPSEHGFPAPPRRGISEVAGFAVGGDDPVMSGHPQYGRQHPGKEHRGELGLHDRFEACERLDESGRRYGQAVPFGPGSQLVPDPGLPVDQLP